METWLNLFDRYGLPLLILIGAVYVLTPLARKVAEKHVEVIDALGRSSAANALAVDKMVEMIRSFGVANKEAHSETHTVLRAVGDRLTRIDSRYEMVREMAVTAERSAAAAHQRLDHAGAASSHTTMRRASPIADGGDE